MQITFSVFRLLGLNLYMDLEEMRHKVMLFSPPAPPLPHCYWSQICNFLTTLFHVTKRFSYKKNSDALFFILGSELEYEGKVDYHFGIKPAVF